MISPHVASLVFLHSACARQASRSGLVNPIATKTSSAGSSCSLPVSGALLSGSMRATYDAIDTTLLRSIGGAIEPSSLKPSGSGPAYREVSWPATSSPTLPAVDVSRGQGTVS